MVPVKVKFASLSANKSDPKDPNAPEEEGIKEFFSAEQQQRKGGLAQRLDNEKGLARKKNEFERLREISDDEKQMSLDRKYAYKRSQSKKLITPEIFLEKQAVAKPTITYMTKNEISRNKRLQGDYQSSTATANKGPSFKREKIAPSTQ